MFVESSRRFAWRSKIHRASSWTKNIDSSCAREIRVVLEWWRIGFRILWVISKYDCADCEILTPPLLHYLESIKPLRNHCWWRGIEPKVKLQNLKFENFSWFWKFDFFEIFENFWPAPPGPGGEGEGGRFFSRKWKYRVSFVSCPNMSS